MRLNKISDATKILIISATIIVVCVIVALGFKMVNEGKSSTGSGLNQFNEMTSEYSNVSLTNYDGSTVLGSEVVNFVNKAIDGQYIYSIVIDTNLAPLAVYHLGDLTYADLSLILGSSISTTREITLDTTSEYYINPNAQFLGKIYKNDNGIVTCITFTQQ